jgi:hypothetical protein
MNPVVRPPKLCLELANLSPRIAPPASPFISLLDSEFDGLARGWLEQRRSRSSRPTAPALQKQDKLFRDSAYLDKANVVTQDADRARLADLESESKAVQPH